MVCEYLARFRGHEPGPHRHQLDLCMTPPKTCKMWEHEAVVISPAPSSRCRAVPDIAE